MATIFASYSFDQAGLDLYGLNVDSFNIEFFDDIFTQYNGVVYRDALVIDAFRESTYRAVFAGEEIRFNGFLEYKAA